MNKLRKYNFETKDLIALFFNYIRHRRNLKIRLSQYLEWNKKHKNRIKSFRDIHRDEHCFIIGNGPSLNKMNLLPLNEYYTFGLNKIYLLLNNINLNIDYLVSVNRFVIQQGKTEFKNTNCPTFLSYRYSNGLFNEFEHIYYILTRYYIETFQKDLTKGLWEGYTVTFVAMQIAYYMGFKKVFLIGVDHNYSYQGKPNEVQFNSNDDHNHFDPNYFKGTHWQLPDLMGSERAYRLAKETFENDSRFICDATLNGKLNIFPKISYEKALDICKKK